MKIALDHQIFSSQKYGGISRYHIQLGEALLKMGENIAAFSPLHKNVYLHNHPLMEKGRFINWVPPKTTRLIKWYNNLISRKRIKQWSPDIIHETYYSPNPIGGYGTPTVITVHDMIHELYPDYYLGKVIKQQKIS